MVYIITILLIIINLILNLIVFNVFIIFIVFIIFNDFIIFIVFIDFIIILKSIRLILLNIIRIVNISVNSFSLKIKFLDTFIVNMSAFIDNCRLLKVSVFLILEFPYFESILISFRLYSKFPSTVIFLFNHFFNVGDILKVVNSFLLL